MSKFEIVATAVMLAGCLGMAGYVAYCYLTAPAVMTTGTLRPEDPPITRPSTTMDKLAYATKRSATLFVQLATGFVIMLGNGILNMADFFGAPEVRDWVKMNLTPEVASGVVVILVGITVWSRVRNSIGSS